MSEERCEPEIYERGKGFLVTDLNTKRMEPWVQKLAELSGQRVDWHYVGGRAVVCYIGDRAKVQAAFEQLMPELARLQRERASELRVPSHSLTDYPRYMMLDDE